MDINLDRYELELIRRALDVSQHSNDSNINPYQISKTLNTTQRFIDSFNGAIFAPPKTCNYNDADMRNIVSALEFLQRGVKEYNVDNDKKSDIDENRLHNLLSRCIDFLKNMLTRQDDNNISRQSIFNS